MGGEEDTRNRTHLSALLLDPLHDVLHAVHVHRLVLVHVYRQAAAPDEKQDQLVHDLLFRRLVPRRRLI